jgi:hypothetical protein
MDKKNTHGRTLARTLLQEMILRSEVVSGVFLPKYFLYFGPGEVRQPGVFST